MNTNQNLSVSPDELDEAFAMVSRQLDGDLSDDESARLAAIEALSPKSIAEFRQQCLRLQSVLRQIPVQPVEDVLFSAPQRASVQTEGWVRQQRNGVVWGSLIVITLACLLLAVVQPWNSSLSTDASRLLTDSEVPPSPVLMSKSGIPNSSQDQNQAEETVSAALTRQNDPTAGNTSDSTIRPLFETEDWNIVVVKLDEQNRELAMERIHSIVEGRGFQLQNSFADSKSEFLGVVVTSAVAENEQLVSEMEKGVAGSLVQRDSNSIAKTRREEIVTAVRKSLQHPTQSEFHHGQFYLALSTDSGKADSAVNVELANSGNLPAERPAAADTAVASSKADSAKSPADERSAAKIADGSNSAITLIVFEFRSDDGLPANNSSGKQI